MQNVVSIRPSMPKSSLYEQVSGASLGIEGDSLVCTSISSFFLFLLFLISFLVALSCGRTVEGVSFTFE